MMEAEAHLDKTNSRDNDVTLGEIDGLTSAHGSTTSLTPQVVVGVGSELTHTAKINFKAPKSLDVQLYYAREDQLKSLEGTTAGEACFTMAFSFGSGALGVATGLGASEKMQESAWWVGTLVALVGLTIVTGILAYLFRGERKKVFSEIRGSAIQKGQ